MHKLNHIVVLLSMLFLSTAYGQIVTDNNDTISGPISIGGVDVNFLRPQSYELGPIRVIGADNFDHNAIKLLAGLRQGQRITIPGEKISTAIRNLWNEGLFSDVEIMAEKEVAGVLYLIIRVAPRPKLSRFKFNGVTKREADKVREVISVRRDITQLEWILNASEIL
jgi:outer membrane protein insertion porin family